MRIGYGHLWRAKYETTFLCNLHFHLHPLHFIALHMLHPFVFDFFVSVLSMMGGLQRFGYKDLYFLLVVYWYHVDLLVCIPFLYWFQKKYYACAFLMKPSSQLMRPEMMSYCLRASWSRSRSSILYVKATYFSRLKFFATPKHN